MAKPVVFLDSNFFNDVFGRGSAFNKDLGIAFLNTLIKNNEVRITDRINVESTSDLSFAKDLAVREWLNANSITPMPTKVGAGVIAGTEPVKDSGERSIIEATKSPEFAGREVHIISNDNFYNLGGEGEAYVDKVIHLQDLAKQFLHNGDMPITDYNIMAENNATLNKGDPNVTPWLTKPQQFNETPFSNDSGHKADAGGIVTDPQTGTKYSLSEVFKNLITNESGGTGTITDLAHYLGTDVATLEHALVRGAAGVLGAVGIAAMIADIANTSVTARGQLDHGDVAGAQQSVAALAARTGLGVAGAEAGYALGVAAAGVLGISAGAPLAIAAGLIMGTIIAIDGVISGDAIISGRLNQAIQSLINGLGDLINSAFPSGDDTSLGDDIGAISSGFNSSMTDPIVLGLNGSNIELTSLATSNAYFDLHGTGFAVHTGWVGANTGLLVNSATPTSINNLFGNSSIDGFTALKTVDSDGNNIINSNDSGFSQLYVWADADGDGVADAGEVKTLAALGITSISLGSTPVEQNVGGNLITKIATFTYSNGNTGQVAEAFFNNSQLDSQFTGSYTINPSVLILPNLRGYGTLPPLYIAMSIDSSLLNLVKNLANENASNILDFDAQVTAILYKWAGVENIDPASRGGYFDAQKLAVLEAFNGQKFVNIFGNNSNPANAHIAESLNEAWDALLTAMEARLLVQGPLATVFNKMQFNYDTDSLIGSIDATEIAKAVPVGVFKASQYWHDMVKIANHFDIPDDQVLSALQTAFNQTNAPFSWASTQGDNFVFAAGDGSITVNEKYNTSGVLTIIGSGANASNTILQANDNGDLTVILSTGDKITFQNDLSFADGAGSTYGNFSKITQINFASGAPLVMNNYNWAGLATNQQLTFTWNDTAGNNNIVGSKFGNNVFNLGAGDDAIKAGASTANNTTNTFVFHKGDGHDIVNMNGGTGILELSADIAVSDVTPLKNANGDLTILLSTGDSITFLNDLSFADGVSDKYGYISKVSQIQFANGVIWDKNRILTSGKGDYYIAGSGSDDLYVHKQGDGTGIIAENGFSGNDTLKLTGTALTSTGVSVSRSADLMSATLSFAGITDKITLDNQFGPYGAGVENITFSNGVTWTKDDLQKKYLATISTAGNDTIYGFGSNVNHTINDIITGGKGDDYMNGLMGDDTYIHNQGDGVDTIFDDGFSGNETLKLTGSALTSANAILTRSGSDVYTITIGFAGVTDKIILDREFGPYGQGIENITFSNGVTWTKTDLQANYIAKAGTIGNDSIYGFYGRNDTIIGGKGDDYLNGLDGNDTYIHNQGDGVDTIDELGGAGSDTLNLTGVALTSTNFAITKTGADGYTASITFGGVVDKILITRQFDWLPNGVEKITFSDGVILNSTNLIAGSATNDTLTGNDNNNFLFGFAGNDSISGGLGNDMLNGGAGADKLDGGTGTDTASYMDSTAAVTVNLGVTTAQTGGYAAGDTLISIENIIGSAYNDILTGSAVANIMTGGAGADKMDGVAGVDTVSYADSNAAVNVNLAVTTAQTGGYAQGDTLFNIENIIGSAYDDALAGSSVANKIDGGAGADTVSYSNSTAAVTVNLGVTTAQAGGYAAGDILVSIENIIGTPLNDTLTGSTANNIIIGGAGADKMDGAAGIDTVSYAGSNAAVNVNLAVTTAQVGGHAAGDTIFNIENIIGSSYNDTLKGSSIANIINGGSGNDTMTGGTGADVFKFSAITDSGKASGARDIITDFVRGTDKIDLADYAGTFTFKGTGALGGSVHGVNYAQVSGNTIIGIDADGNGTLDMQIQLTGLHALTSSDFLL